MANRRAFTRHPTRSGLSAALTSAPISARSRGFRSISRAFPFAQRRNSRAVWASMIPGYLNRPGRARAPDHVLCGATRIPRRPRHRTAQPLAAAVTSPRAMFLLRRRRAPWAGAGLPTPAAPAGVPARAALPGRFASAWSSCPHPGTTAAPPSSAARFPSPTSARFPLGPAPAMDVGVPTFRSESFARVKTNSKDLDRGAAARGRLGSRLVWSAHVFLSPRRPSVSRAAFRGAAAAARTLWLPDLRGKYARSEALAVARKSRQSQGGSKPSAARRIDIARPRKDLAACACGICATCFGGLRASATGRTRGLYIAGCAPGLGRPLWDRRTSGAAPRATAPLRPLLLHGVRLAAGRRVPATRGACLSVWAWDPGSRSSRRGRQLSDAGLLVAPWQPRGARAPRLEPWLLGSSRPSRRGRRRRAAAQL